MQQTKSIESIANLLETVFPPSALSHGFEKILYRGQALGWKLLPKLARPAFADSYPESLRQSQSNMIQDFKDRATPYLRREPSCLLEWLAVARQHGLPTLLLDWTENPLIALWFAVRERSRGEEDRPVVWALRLKKGQVIENIADFKAPENGLPMCFRAPLLSKRIAAQASWFSIHDFDTDHNRFIPLEESVQANLYRMNVDYPIPEIRRQLGNCGIHAGTVLPGLDGLCESIAMERVPAAC